MDDSLLMEYIDNVVLPLYPNISKTAAFDETTGKLLHGPVVLKLDSGPGCIVASMAVIRKREELAEMGLLILAGLPNATSVQQETDQVFGSFKSATYARSKYILMQKMRVQGVAMRQRQMERRAQRLLLTDEGVGVIPPPAKMSVLTLGFEYLATLINGSADDPIAMNSFDCHFTKEKILGAWQKVGFVPFTRKCLFDKNVRHELGQTDLNVNLEE